MQAFLNIISDNIALIALVMLGVIIGLVVVCVIAMVQLNKLKKRYEFFMGEDASPRVKFETKLNEYISDVKGLKVKYSRMLKLTEDIDKNLSTCVQKVGMVRYNPFDEVGGNLCFSVALLDSNDDGVVLTGIHSRTGSFTYAKPVELSVSPYVLSEEEMEAITKAKNSQYLGIDRADALQRINEKKFHVKVRPKRKKYIRDNKFDNENFDNTEIKGQVGLDEIIKEDTKMESQIELDDIISSEKDENLLQDLETEISGEMLSTEKEVQIVDNSEEPKEAVEESKAL